MGIDCFSATSIIKELAELSYDMWQKGWDESNGGNISCILTDEDLSFLQKDESYKTTRNIKVQNIPADMVGKYLIITASGSHFRILKNNLTKDLGVILILEDGYNIVWGFKENKRPTSELYMHLLSHSARLKANSHHRVVVHNHANNATAHSLLVAPNDRDYTLPLWKILTESVIVFPDGVGVVPWQLPGTEAIGLATAKKLEKTRIVVWAYHGILATGTSFQECFGLIETVDKAAKIYRETLNVRITDGLTEKNIKDFCRQLRISYREDIIG